VIQGVDLDCEDSGTKLREQYLAAEEFLGRLADEFVGGDRSRIVIVPGNHDVDWNVARSAMKLVPPGEEPEPKKVFFAASEYRWSWRNRRFYRIADPDKYLRRFDPFWDFVEQFYSGVKGIPRLARNEPCIFALDQGRIGVAAFNSCYGNDCFAFHGAIEPGDVARTRERMARDYEFRLWIGVWHHSIQGAPYKTDYMDVEEVHDMVGYGFRLGLHGHQHKHQVIPTHVHLPDRETMSVVSAGSLCAGKKELPTGFYRQYNIIEISDNRLSARVHVRQMETAHLFTGCHLTPAGGKTFVDVEWTPPYVGLRRAHSEDAPSARVVFQAESQIATGRYGEAAEMLAHWMPGMSGYGRSLFVTACVRSEQWELLTNHITVPRDIDELLAIVHAYDRRHMPAKALEVTRQYGSLVSLQPHQAAELERRLQIGSRQ